MLYFTFDREFDVEDFLQILLKFFKNVKYREFDVDALRKGF